MALAGYMFYFAVAELVEAISTTQARHRRHNQLGFGVTSKPCRIAAQRIASDEACSATLMLMLMRSSMACVPWNGFVLTIQQEQVFSRTSAAKTAPPPGDSGARRVAMQVDGLSRVGRCAQGARVALKPCSLTNKE